MNLLTDLPAAWTMTTPNIALILIDLQNEFLAPEGNFPVDKPQELLDNIRQLVAAFRISHESSPIFWIRAEYPPVHGEPDSAPGSQFNVLTGKHTGRKACCYAGTSGVEFPEVVMTMITDADMVITKTWYSAFKETTLDDELRARGVTKLFIAGLLTNVCVISTATQAVNLGYDVSVIESYLGWKRIQSHKRALESIRDLGIHVIPNVQSLGSGDQDNLLRDTHTIPSLYYVNGSIPSWRVLMALYEKVSVIRWTCVVHADRPFVRIYNSRCIAEE